MPATDPVRWAFLTGVKLLKAGRASLLLRLPNEPRLAVAASVGIDTEVLRQIHVTVGQGIAGTVAERGAYFLGVRDSMTFISVPVRSDRGVEGVLNLTERQGGEPFGDEHVEQAQIVADHLGSLLAYDRHNVHDTLSGLPNGRAFLDMVERELARSKRAGSPFAVATLCLEIHDAGPSEREGLIRAVANVLQGSLRSYDSAGYLGEGEFGLLLAFPFEGVRSVHERILGRIAETAREVEADVNVRIGFARCPQDGTDAQRLLKVAQDRMADADPSEDQPS